jgi:hypothetical protein
MDTTRWLLQLLYASTTVLPWLIGGVLGLAIFSFSPLGRGILRHLRESRRDTALNEQMLAELTALRAELGDVMERLDSTERLLSTSALPELRHDRAARPFTPTELRDPDRIPTPT